MQHKNSPRLTTELLKDKSKCPHIVVVSPDHLNALVRDKVLGDMVGEEVSCRER